MLQGESPDSAKKVNIIDINYQQPRGMAFFAHKKRQSPEQRLPDDRATPVKPTIVCAA
jgi:hypothetical protein